MGSNQLNVLQPLKKDLTFLQQHERLVFGLFAVIVLVFGIMKYQDRRVIETTTQLQIATQQAADAKQQAEWNARATAQVEAELQLMVDTLSKQNATLANAITSRTAALEKQKGTDASLPLASLALRLQTLANAPQDSVFVNGTTVTVTQPGAVSITQTLEEVPVLQSNLNDSNKIVANQKQELGKFNELVQTQSSQITGLGTELSAQQTQCKAQVGQLKASARKSKRNWFIAGYVSGLLTRGAIKLFLGV